MRIRSPLPLAVCFVLVRIVALIERPCAADSPRDNAWGYGVVLVAVLAIAPALVRSTQDAAFDLTIHNAASSEKTLEIMTLMAAIGMPLVVTYTIVVYRTFWGKVKLDDFSY